MLFRWGGMPRLPERLQHSKTQPRSIAAPAHIRPLAVLRDDGEGLQPNKREQPCLAQGVGEGLAAATLSVGRHQGGKDLLCGGRDRFHESGLALFFLAHLLAHQLHQFDSDEDDGASPDAQ